MQAEKVALRDRDREEASDVQVGTSGKIWPFEPGRCKVFKAYTEDLKIAAKIAGWKGCRYHATYYFPDGRVLRGVLVPVKLYKRAATLLGLAVPAKNPNRVRAGKKAGAAALAYHAIGTLLTAILPRQVSTPEPSPDFPNTLSKVSWM